MLFEDMEKTCMRFSPLTVFLLVKIVQRGCVNGAS